MMGIIVTCSLKCKTSIYKYFIHFIRKMHFHWSKIPAQCGLSLFVQLSVPLRSALLRPSFFSCSPSSTHPSSVWCSGCSSCPAEAASMSAGLAASTSTFWISGWPSLDNMDGSVSSEEEASSRVGGRTSVLVGSSSSSLSSIAVTVFPLVDFLTVVKDNDRSSKQMKSKLQTNDL